MMMMKMAEIELQSAVGQKSHSLGLNLTHKPFIRQELEVGSFLPFFDFSFSFILTRGQKILKPFVFLLKLSLKFKQC